MDNGRQSHPRRTSLSTAPSSCTSWTPLGRLQITCGSFNANAAWLVLAVIAFNLTRAAGCLASLFHARARTSTIREQLVRVAGRVASSGRRFTLHLPRDWPWEQSCQQLFDTATDPPRPHAA